MNIYKIKVKDIDNPYGKYLEFVVIGKSINDMLENLYSELIPARDEIPYYLRSSNFEITNLGEFIPRVNLEDKVIIKYYISEDL